MNEAANMAEKCFLRGTRAEAPAGVSAEAAETAREARALPEETTLALVRELSENATLRPAPRKLHCKPWVPYCIHPVNRLKEKLDMRIHIALVLAEMGRSLRAPNSALRT